MTSSASGLRALKEQSARRRRGKLPKPQQHEARDLQRVCRYVAQKPQAHSSFGGWGSRRPRMPSRAGRRTSASGNCGRATSSVMDRRRASRWMDIGPGRGPARSGAGAQRFPLRCGTHTHIARKITPKRALCVHARCRVAPGDVRTRLQLRPRERVQFWYPHHPACADDDNGCRGGHLLRASADAR
jgi:hypothetical protein